MQTTEQTIHRAFRLKPDHIAKLDELAEAMNESRTRVIWMLIEAAQKPQAAQVEVELPKSV
jgi:predicted transcriptional regulator